MPSILPSVTSISLNPFLQFDLELHIPLILELFSISPRITLLLILFHSSRVTYSFYSLNLIILRSNYLRLFSILPSVTKYASRNSSNFHDLWNFLLQSTNIFSNILSSWNFSSPTLFKFNFTKYIIVSRFNNIGSNVEIKAGSCPWRKFTANFPRLTSAAYSQSSEDAWKFGEVGLREE